jgi:thiol:disulfide interchange protein DsbC
MFDNIRMDAPARRALIPAAMVAWVFFWTGRPAIADAGRWYDESQVAQGAQVFAQNCAQCHGANAEAKPDWRTRGPDGKFPPPPLNGTAHAWHHPLNLLRQTVRQGGAPVGGVMPPFADKLSAEEIDAAIAFFQSHWSDETYTSWQSRSPEAARLQRVSSESGPENAATAGLRRLLPEASIGKTVPTPVPGVLQVKVGSDYAYVTRDGQYAFVGDLLDLRNGSNLTLADRQRDTRALMDAIPPQDQLLYPAQGQEKARIHVFTDSSCPFCRKLHKELPSLSRAGIAVVYVPFPRAGTQGDGYHTMRSVWCADDRRDAMDLAMGPGMGEDGKGNCVAAVAVDRGYQLGLKVGVQGTPAIVLPDGSLAPGYMAASAIVKRIQQVETSKSTSGTASASR